VAYDAIVIGAGPAGEVCSAKLAAGGMRVACAESELVAGECSYWGCMPSKTLLRPPEALAAARRAPGADAAITGEIDPAAVFAFRDFMVDDWDDTEHAKWLEDNGVELLRGEGRIAAPGLVEIAGQRHETKHVVIATGSKASIPPIRGLDEIEDLWTNREATEAKEVPGRLLILGGGPIGAEMAQAFARLGSSVCLVESADRLLPGSPLDACRALSEALEEDGVELRIGANAVAAEQHGSKCRLKLDGGEGLEGDRLLVATGRKPRVEGLGLENAEIVPGDKGIEVDGQMRAAGAAERTVWAIGDVNGVAPLTHVAKYQARIAAADILGKNPGEADYRAIPKITYTDPQVALVGETEAKHEVTVGIASTARNSTYYRDAKERPGFLTLYSDGAALTGACAVGPEAGEWIGQATVAVRARIPLATLRDTIQPFPTFSELFHTALDRLDA
jgi:pyruvate/2-oxoglutarate dehydrogenase complex dihydrolipoamide dehydrogenase (E3) component